MSEPKAGEGARSERVHLNAEGPLGWLQIDHPPVNVLSGEVLRELADALGRLLERPECRVVILSGAGERGFSAGANLREMAGLNSDQARLHSLRGQAVANLLELLPMPVVAAVHGACFGGGSELVEACDIVLASDDARFGQPEINLGVIPGWGGTRRLPRLIGPARAREWILTGDPRSAAEALEAGLVSRIVPRDRLLEEARTLALKLSQKPPEALAAAKYAVNHAVDGSRWSGLEYERRLWGRLFDSSDQKEGMRAFLEKRPASFQAPRGVEEQANGFPWSSSTSLLAQARSLAKLALEAQLPGSQETLARWARFYGGTGAERTED
jgi:enoyl-CoA hydratase/carnithine racemase